MATTTFQKGTIKEKEMLLRFLSEQANVISITMYLKKTGAEHIKKMFPKEAKELEEELKQCRIGFKIIELLDDVIHIKQTINESIELKLPIELIENIVIL